MQNILVPAILAGRLGITIEAARDILAGKPAELPESIFKKDVHPLGR